MGSAASRWSPASRSDGSESLVEIGRVLRPHGLRGDLLVQLHGEDAENLIPGEDVRLLGGPGERRARLDAVEVAGRLRDGRMRVRLRVQGIGSRTDAEVWRGAALSIPAAALRPLPPGEYYWRELIGLRCRLSSGTLLGVIEEIWPTGSNDVLVIRDGTREWLLPALRTVLRRLDRAAGELWVDPPPGLLEGE